MTLIKSDDDTMETAEDAMLRELQVNIRCDAINFLFLTLLLVAVAFREGADFRVRGSFSSCFISYCPYYH